MEKQFKDYMNGLKEEVNSEVLNTIEQHGQSPSELFGDRKYPDGVHFKQINGRVQPDDDDDLDEDEEEDDLILGDEDELDEDDLNEDDIDVEVDDDLDDEDFDEDDLVLGDDDDDEDDDEDAI
jgi:hypothetical protein